MHIPDLTKYTKELPEAPSLLTYKVADLNEAADDLMLHIANLLMEPLNMDSEREVILEDDGLRNALLRLLNDYAM